MKKILLLSLFTILVSCRQHSTLETAMFMSGDNRTELQKVLDHYADTGESQKLAAATFLIENMPGHYSFSGDWMDQCQQCIKDRYPDLPPYIKQALYIAPFEQGQIVGQFNRQEDIEHISAEFLIKHIDNRFRLWEILPWKEDITFHDFCEYLLPYKIGEGPIPSIEDEDQFAEYTDQINSLVSGIPENGFSIFELKNFLIEKVAPEKGVNNTYALPAPFDRYIMTCGPIAHYTFYKLQHLGIPNAVDFTPHWSDQNGRHFWNFVFDQQSLHSTINENDEHQPVKVYRKTYTHNPIPEQGTDYIPEFFQSPFNKDITDLYSKTIDFDVKLNTKTGVKPRYAYLALFNDRKWQPVAWANIKHGKARFEKIGVGAIYLPIYYIGSKQFAANSPILVSNNGEIKFLCPDTQNKESATLTRKYPLKSKKLTNAYALVGNRIEGANMPDFSDADTIALINSPDFNYQYTIATAQTSKKYRYGRIVCTNYPTIAELAFKDTRGSIIKGEPICPLENMSLASKAQHPTKISKYFAYIDPTTNRHSTAFDGDPLTYTLCSSWLGMDFGEPTEIASVECMPQNDGNYIYPGDEYELFYWDENRWISLDNRIADNHKLDYEIPTNALFWLRNLSRGKEERPFTLENGKAIFW